MDTAAHARKPSPRAHPQPTHILTVSTGPDESAPWEYAGTILLTGGDEILTDFDRIHAEADHLDGAGWYGEDHDFEIDDPEDLPAVYRVLRMNDDEIQRHYRAERITHHDARYLTREGHDSRQHDATR